MANLTSLNLLDLSYNALTGSFPGEIIRGMTRLQVLDISGNEFRGPLPVFGIAAMKNLSRLDLGLNRFSGEIPESYDALQSLGYLALDGNQISGGIPGSFGNMWNLEFLFLQGNKLSGQIPGRLFYLRSLIKLHLSANRLSGAIPEDSFSVDVGLNPLVELSLSDNNLHGGIPGSIGDLANLEVLKLRGNNFSLELPKNLGQNRKLKLVDVSSNHLTGFIPPDLCQGAVLETLILDNNFLTGPLLPELGRCRSLRTIKISNNLLNGTIPASIFQRRPSAHLIELDNNFFSGQLPHVMWVTELSALVLSNNRITGKIPPAIGNLIKLKALLLDGNELSDVIPDELCNLRFLSTVNISSNNITGNIPSCIARCSYLRVLDLSRNQLQGQIPCSLVNGTLSLETLNLSYNELSGRIPTYPPFFPSLFSGNPKLLGYSKADCSSQGYSAIVIIISIIVGLSFWLLIASIFVVTVRMKRKQNNDKKPIRPWILTSFQKVLQGFKVEDILDCIKEENIIGKGGEGVVYLGPIVRGVEVAIKQPIKQSSERDSGFAAEVRTLGQIRHKHIVKLLGCVSNSNDSSMLLLYEYMSNGSLADMLHGPNGGSLNWEMRYKIAVETAMGLSYLHHDCSPPIIHRDIKPHNILLDSDLEAHIADFGLSKLWHHRQPPPGSSYHMSFVVGTFGYLAPEYAHSLKVDEKIDVYSYGVVMLELISGRKAVGGFGEGMNIVMWVRELTSKFIGKTNANVAKSVVVEILDPRIVEQCQVASATHMLEIAIMCVDTESSARPTMREVVHLLTTQHILT